MTDPAPKPSSPWRWIFIGCGAFTALGVLGLAGFGTVFYFIAKKTEPIADVGAAYLQNAPSIQEAVGAPVSVKRDWLGWNVRMANDAGTAFFTYKVTGWQGSGSAKVWIEQPPYGVWTASGAQFRPDGGAAPILLGAQARSEE